MTELENEREAPILKLRKSQHKPSGKIGYLLLCLGLTFLLTSIFWPVYSNPFIPAFIGLGLTFWGALILFIKPTKYVRRELLNHTTTSSLSTLNKIISELNYRGKAIYLPPKHLKSLKGGIIFIPKEDKVVVPKVEELIEEKFFLKNPGGLCLTSPGLGLMALYEEELGVDFSKVDINYLQNNLPKLFIEGLEILEDFEMTLNGNMINVKMTGSVFKDFCKNEGSINTCKTIGCPLCGSIACLLTKVLGKTLIIEEIDKSPDGKVTEIQYQIVEVLQN